MDMVFRFGQMGLSILVIGLTIVQLEKG